MEELTHKYSFGKYNVLTDSRTPFLHANNDRSECAIFGYAVNVFTGSSENLAQDIIDNCSNISDVVAFEKNLVLFVGIASVGILSSLTALFNTLGRFCYSTVSDYLKRKEIIYMIIFASSAISIMLGMISMTMLPIVILLCIINAGYGGGFSTLPTLLQSKFGMDKISTIHGLALSAWAWAGLSGNQLSNAIINKMNLSYEYLFVVLLILYIISFVVTFNLKNTSH